MTAMSRTDSDCLLFSNYVQFVACSNSNVRFSANLDLYKFIKVVSGSEQFAAAAIRGSWELLLQALHIV